MERIGDGACFPTSHHALAKCAPNRNAEAISLLIFDAEQAALTIAFAFSHRRMAAKALQIPCCSEFRREFSKLPLIAATHFHNSCYSSNGCPHFP
jgi:hypothetical protein